MRHWIGKFLIGVGVVHSTFGVLGLWDTFAVLIAEGIVNTVNGQADREFAFWFVDIGLFWILLGAVINHYEQQGYPLPRFLGGSLGVLALIGVIIMPISGFWLMFIPAWAAWSASNN